MSASPDLITVQEQFRYWRQQRSRRNEPVPQTLRQQAVELCEFHPLSHVIKALEINHSMIKSWRESFSMAEFISLPMPVQDQAIQATIVHPGGMQLQLDGLNPQTLPCLIEQFVAGAVSS